MYEKLSITENHLNSNLLESFVLNQGCLFFLNLTYNLIYASKKQGC